MFCICVLIPTFNIINPSDMKRRPVLLILLLLVITQCLMSQTKTVTGIVTDENNEPMIGVTVVIVGTTTGTVTGIDGSYSISVPTGWTGVVTPSEPHFSFSPTHRAYSNVQADKTGQDYTASWTPDPPSGLTATAISDTQIDLLWTLSPDDATQVDHYNIRRSNGSFVDNVPAHQNSH